MNNARVALVTGAGGGMGTAIVARLVKDGFRVAGFEVAKDRLDAALSGLSGGHRGFIVDITDQAAVVNSVAQVEKEMGPIEVLVNTVGWAETHVFSTENSAYWHKVIQLNYESLLYVIHAVLPGMIERHRGKIVSVASDAGRAGQSGEAVYSGCKGAVIAFSKALAREVARYGVTVNCTSPGPTDTPLEREQEPETIQRIIRHIPMRRWAKPEEQASAISFLCSPDSDYITGQTLSVSGGLTMT